MKKSFFCRMGGAALVLFLLFAACSKTAPPAKNPITPLQTLINSDTSLTFFHRLLLQANETALLADDSVTVLLATNTAFRASGYTETIIDSTMASTADNLVRSHFINSRAIPDSGVYTPYITLAGNAVYGTNSGAGLFLFNDATSGSGIPVGKALVYRLNSLIQPGADSLDILLGQDTSLTFINEALLRTHLYDSLAASGVSLTLLAPINNAFRAAGYDSLAAIDSADSNVLIQLVENQFLKGSWFIRSLSQQHSLPTLQGSPVTITQQNGGIQFTGNSQPVPANLLNGGQTAGATIIVYRIDQVLSP